MSRQQGFGSAHVMGITPVDLFRKGNATSPQMDKVRPRLSDDSGDIELFTQAGETWVRANSGGISTSSKRKGDAKWWKLVQGYAYDNGLRVWNDHGNHYSWEPVEDMPLERFKALLAAVNPELKRAE